MKKIEELLQTLSDPQLIIDGLKTIEVEAINKYWLSGKLQEPKGEDLSSSEIKRLLLIAFAPEYSLPARHRNAPRLKTCQSFFRLSRTNSGQKTDDIINWSKCLALEVSEALAAPRTTFLQQGYIKRSNNNGASNKYAFDMQGEFTLTKDFDALPLNFYSDIFQALQTKKVIIEPESLQSHFITGKLAWLKGIKELEIVAPAVIQSSIERGPSLLQTLPDDIGELIDLETLIIESSDVSILPDSFYNLKNLKILHLVGNKLSSLSENINQLVALETFDVEFNQLERIPASLSSIKNLKNIFIWGNPLKEISDCLAFENHMGLTHKSEIAFSNPIQDWNDCPKNILVLSHYWLEIPMTRIEEIIAKNGITKLAIRHSSEMLKKVLEPKNIDYFKKITCLLIPSFSNLEELPESIGQMYWLEELELTCNIPYLGFPIIKLPESIFNLKKLKKLKLYGDKLDLPIPNLFSSFSELTHLELRLSPLNGGVIPESIFSLSKLQVLDLSWNKKIAELSPQIGNLVNLEELNLYPNMFSTLPSDFGNLKKLKKLNLGGDALTSFPEVLLNLPLLEELNLESQKISELPNNLTGLKNLKNLDLKSNELQILPDSIGHLINLETLNLERNKITSISEEIKLCSQLKNLNLASNELLDKLPESIGDLTKLESINLCQCKLIQSLPPSSSNLSNLKILNLGYTVIPELPAAIFELTSLAELKLNDLPITSLNPEIKNLVNLEYLDLSGTKITELPTEIGCLIKLTKLDGPAFNKSLPDSFCNLINLKELRVDFDNVKKALPENFGNLINLEMFNPGSRLDYLPASFGKLSKLKALTIRYSTFTEFPMVLTELQSLNWLDLWENQFTDVPYELTKLKTLTSLSFDYNPMTPSIQKKCKALLPGADISF